MKNCLDTGTIQAFLDGELAPAEASAVSAHIAQCDACAAQLAAAEEESAFVFSVLEREIDSLVPTQRLWIKINDSITVEKQSAPFWKKAWAYILTSLANPSIAVAAGMLVVLGVFAVILMEQRPDSPPGIAGVRQTTQTGPASLTAINEANPPKDTDSGTANSTGTSVAAPEVASYSSAPRSYIKKPMADNFSRPTAQQAVYIPGEESYVKTIASLSQTVNGQKDTVMRPSERIAYERDMAVVNDAIKKMKKEVRRNPKNESAKQVLYTSYQNKIDLLNSVSQREELVASLK